MKQRFLSKFNSAKNKNKKNQKTKNIERISSRASMHTEYKFTQNTLDQIQSVN